MVEPTQWHGAVTKPEKVDNGESGANRKFECKGFCRLPRIVRRVTFFCGERVVSHQTEHQAW